MALTVTEKNHWKTRIAQMIQRKIDRLLLTKPGFLPGIDKQARANVDKRLGLDHDHAKIDKLEATIEDLKEQLEEIEKESKTRIMSATGRQGTGSECQYVNGGYRYAYIEALKDMNAAEAQRLLEIDTLGRQIVELRTWKDDAMDAVWLATSDKQLVDLWARCEQLLGLTASKLLEEAKSLIAPTGPPGADPAAPPAPAKPKRSHKKKVVAAATVEAPITDTIEQLTRSGTEAA